ncbi:hypothetical protein M6B38_321475 [Iris pallida]|uniref:Uncharacterized protein n=1 Tax=Iris pallida TaxID=29817 RepID=A0AAX6HCE9_IRIPA|nr:hypothetical protein M6B38_110925 [Iris pallida]KAJ6838348.1 hypothetical protein M6B38_321475 [Iris pallida]
MRHFLWRASTASDDDERNPTATTTERSCLGGDNAWEQRRFLVHHVETSTNSLSVFSFGSIANLRAIGSIGVRCYDPTMATRL